jgi:predicted negative regulator of RcsB-dependent stress response
LERAQALASAGDGHVAEALRSLDEGVAELGPVVTLQLLAIELELRRKTYDAALARLDAVAAQSPRKETWLERRGQILASAGRAAEAGEAFVAALAAVEALPPPRRRVRAVIELEARLRTALARSSSRAASH